MRTRTLSLVLVVTSLSTVAAGCDGSHDEDVVRGWGGGIILSRSDFLPGGLPTARADAVFGDYEVDDIDLFEGDEYCFEAVLANPDEHWNVGSQIVLRVPPSTEHILALVGSAYEWTGDPDDLAYGARYDVEIPGGDDLPGGYLTAALLMPSPVGGITQDQDLTGSDLTWGGGSATASALLTFPQSSGTSITCVTAHDGSFTIPLDIRAGMPASGTITIEVREQVLGVAGDRLLELAGSASAEVSYTIGS